MILTPPSYPRLFTIFLRMRLLKLLNFMTLGSKVKRSGKAGGAKKIRAGTHSRFIPSFGLAIFFFVFMGFTSFGFHSGQLQLISDQFAHQKLKLPAAWANEPMRMPDHTLHYFPLPPSFGYSIPFDAIEVYAVYFALILLSALFLTLGTSDFRKTEWDLEWLVTLPLSKKLLMVLRIFERTASNPILILAVVPPVILLLLNQHWNPVLAAAVGIAVSIPVLCLSACAQTLIDTGVRLHWRPARIKNLQAIINLSGAALFYLISLSGTSVSGVVVWIKEVAGGLFAVFPTGLLLQSIFATEKSLVFLILFILLCAGLTFAGFKLLIHLLRGGVVSGSGQSSLRGRPTSPSRTDRLPEFFSAFSVREIRMLIRDHQYLAQTLLTPLMILCLQIYFLWKSKGQLFADSRTAAAVAFGMAGYSLMTSCYMVLVTEGPALWIWYTFPKNMQQLLFQKVARWGWLAAFYVLLFFSWCMIQSGGNLSIEFVFPFITALFGIPVLLVIATSLGILGFEGPSATPQRRMKPSSTYLYLLSLAAYMVCFFIPTYWLSLVAYLFMVLIAYAFWEKARARMPYLLDPASVPEPKVGLAEGLIAAQCFFLLHQLSVLVQLNRPVPMSGLILVKGFSLAGLITFLSALYYFRLTGLKPVFSHFWVGLKKDLLITGFSAVILALFSELYFFAVGSLSIFDQGVRPQFFQSTSLDGFSFFALALLIPFFSEFIFRGLLFRGFRQTCSFSASMLTSAAVFALVHQPAAMIPAFALGSLSSWLYERSQSLASSILLHAVFNLTLYFLLTHGASLSG